MKVKDEGFRRKMKAVKRLAQIATNIANDGAAEVQRVLAQEVLNHPQGGQQWVAPTPQGGLLIQSIDLSANVSDFKRAVFSDLTVAPYAKAVNDRLASTGGFRGKKKSDGLGYFDIVRKLWGPLIVKQATGEIARFVDSASRAKKYSYKNPFRKGR